MAKKLLFFWLFGLTLLGALPLCANNNAENTVASSSECTAPPPDSFRVTYKSTNEIALAWKSAWPGAGHLMDVFIQNPIGGWENVFAAIYIQGESHTVQNLLSGRVYKFEIATVCGNGTQSVHKNAVIDGTLIIELTIGGKTPIEPTTVNCAEIPKNAPWKGFRVSGPTKYGYESNYFEVTFCNDETSPVPQPCVKRVTYDNFIVATDEKWFWPTIFEPKLGTQSPFRMALRTGNDPQTMTIGRIRLIVGTSTIHACPDYNHYLDPWSPAFSFESFTAESSMLHPGGQNERGLAISPKNQGPKILVSNPVGDELTIFFPTDFGHDGATVFSIYSSDGKFMTTQTIINITMPTLSIPTGALPSGIYILRVENQHYTFMTKIIKQ